MSQETYGENDLALLTDEERATLQDDATEDIEKELLDELVKEDQVEVIDEVIAETPVEEILPDVKPEITSEDLAVELPKVEFTTSARYADVPMTETVLPEFSTALADLAKKFDEGEVELPEYMTQRAAIDRQITSYQITEAQQQRTYNTWMDAQDAFLMSNGQYLNNKILFGALDSAVSELQSDPRNKTLSPSQILDKANSLVKEAFGVPKESKKEVTKEAVKPEITKQKNTIPALPTLSDIPASAPNVDQGNPFASIDRLSGDAKEAAVAKLSPEQYDAFLRS